MNLLVPLLLLQTTPPLIHGQAAVDRMKSLLGAFGVPKPYRLQSLGTSFNNGNDFTHVILTDGKKRSWEAYFRVDSLSMWRGKESGLFGGFKTEPLKDKAKEKKLQSWMAAVRSKEPFRLTTLIESEKGLARARYSILRNGYPFVVSWQHYGYDLAMDSSGEILSFGYQVDPPPVDSQPPSISKRKALEILDEIYKAKQPKDGSLRYDYKVIDPMTLGYFKPKEANRAILVWRIPIMASVTSQRGSRGGSNGVLIDARTGKQIPTDVVP